jgi:hypothetical protein
VRTVYNFSTRTSTPDVPLGWEIYRLADETYARLLERFDGHLNDVSVAMRANILMFYGSSENPASAKARAVLASVRAEAAD